MTYATKYSIFLESFNIMLFGKQKPENETVVGLITSALRRDIAFGELPPDKKLKIEELRMRYGGSGHSVREALTLLSAEGLVEASSQRGFRVASATQEDLEDIVRLRAQIECMALEWSLEHGDITWEGRVIAAHHSLAHAQEQVKSAPQDRALEWDAAARIFHVRLIEACGSPRLIAIQQKLYDQSRRFRLAALREGVLDFAALKVIQQSLTDAVPKRDVQLALQCLRKEIEFDLNG